MVYNFANVYILKSIVCLHLPVSHHGQRVGITSFFTTRETLQLGGMANMSGKISAYHAPLGVKCHLEKRDQTRLFASICIEHYLI